MIRNEENHLRSFSVHPQRTLHQVRVDVKSPCSILPWLNNENEELQENTSCLLEILEQTDQFP